MPSSVEAAAQHSPSWLGRSPLRADLDPPVALRDPSTGLATPALLVDRLDHAFTWRSAPPLALLALTPQLPPTLTLDPAAQRAVVRQLSRSLAASLRRADTSAYADPGLFLVLLFDITSALDAGRVAQRLVDALRAREPSREVLPIAVGVAATVTCAPQSSAGWLLDDVMAALAVARDGGGSRIHVAPPHAHAPMSPADSA